MIQIGLQGGKRMEREERKDREFKGRKVFRRITPEERRKVLGPLEKYLKDQKTSSEKMDCKYCVR